MFQRFFHSLLGTFVQLCVRANLSACSISGHTSLASTFVGSILEANNSLTGLQSSLIERALVLSGHFLANDRPIEAISLGQASQSIKVINNHVKVLGLIEIIDLKQVLSD